MYAAVPAWKRFKEFPGLGHRAALARFPNEWKETVAPVSQRRGWPFSPVTI